jgi:dTDP-D-glucose 4,6-dehydratase
LSPKNPYSASKAAADMLVLAYHHTFGIPTVISRSNNVYGPRQYPEKIIPKFLNELLQGCPCPIQGDGSNSRRYLYVDDLIDALLTILNCGELGCVYNIGSDEEFTNLEIAQYLINALDLQDAGLIKMVPNRICNDECYKIDSKEMEKLGWTAKVPFATGIQCTSKILI